MRGRERNVYKGGGVKRKRVRERELIHIGENITRIRGRRNSGNLTGGESLSSRNILSTSM